MRLRPHRVSIHNLALHIPQKDYRKVAATDRNMIFCNGLRE